MVPLMIAIAAGLFVIERIWPATDLPKVRGWWWRVASVNLVQLGFVVLAGITWDRWLQRVSLFHLVSCPIIKLN